MYFLVVILDFLWLYYSGYFYKNGFLRKLNRLIYDIINRGVSINMKWRNLYGDYIFLIFMFLYYIIIILFSCLFF